MRKILLGTTAVVGAALMGMTVAQAQTTLPGYLAGEPRGTPSPIAGVPGSAAAPGTLGVRIGGYFEFTGAWVDDSADRNAVTLSPGQTKSRDKVDFRTDVEMVLIVNGKAANGLSYGAQVEFQIDNVVNSGGAGNGGVVDTDEAWGYVSSPTLGTLQFGDGDSAAAQLVVTLPGSPFQLGASTQWDEFIAQAADGQRYLIADINDGNDSTKIVYLSPQFFGFDFGVSFAPNRREGEEYRNPTGTALQRDPNDTIRNELSGAIRYRGTFGNVGVQAGLAAHRADAQAVSSTAAQLQDVSEYQAGLQVTGFGVTVGGMYRWGRYGGITATPIRTGLGNSSTWGVGASYVLGAVQLGAFYSYAQRDNGAIGSDRTQAVWGLGASYLLAPGLELFGNYTNVTGRNIANSSSNPTAFATAGSGNLGRSRDIDIIVIGTRLTF